MTNRIPIALTLAALAATGAWLRAQQPPTTQQPPEISTTITSEGGRAPLIAVPEFIALSKDAETVAIARTITQVLWDDLNYEHEFALLSRDVYSSIPTATS